MAKGLQKCTCVVALKMLCLVVYVYAGQYHQTIVDIVTVLMSVHFSAPIKGHIMHTSIGGQVHMTGAMLIKMISDR